MAESSNATDPDAQAQPSTSRLRTIDDAQAMRALAHPVRIALLEALRRDGELTATRAAELLDESPGNMSWHLQTLAKYGFIEEAPGAKGRSRPWRLCSDGFRFRSISDDAATDAAAASLLEQVRQRNTREAREWEASHHTYPHEWQQGAFMNDSLAYMTAAELQALSDEINALFSRYNDRAADRSLRPDGALPVRLNAAGFPLPKTPSGN